MGKELAVDAEFFFRNCPKRRLLLNVPWIANIPSLMTFIPICLNILSFSGTNAM